MKSMTKAAFAKLCGVSKPAVQKWVTQGRAVMAGDRIDVVASAAALAVHRKDGIPAQLAALLAGETLDEGAAAAEERPKRPQPAALRAYRRDDLIDRLRAIDWSGGADLSAAGLRARLHQAAAVAGLQAVASPINDDGHWGGWQLRNREVMEKRGGMCYEAVHAGHGFELDEFEAIHQCREVIFHPEHGAADMEDLFEIDLELLPAIAFPLGPHHVRPAP